MKGKAAWPFALCAVILAAPARGQLPTRPENLQVLPKTLSTDSVFNLMLDVADGLGVTCGYCHVGGDRPTWDSTHFASDAIPMKVTARAMFRLTDRLNNELLPAIMNAATSAVPVTCMTCHRGAPRPVTLVETLTRILNRDGVDSLITAYVRFRARYEGRMTYDMSEGTLDDIASGLARAKRFRDASRILEVNAQQFPNPANVAYALGVAYESDGEVQLAVAQYKKVLSIQPDHQRALQHLRALNPQQSPNESLTER